MVRELRLHAQDDVGPEVHRAAAVDVERQHLRRPGETPPPSVADEVDLPVRLDEQVFFWRWGLGHAAGKGPGWLYLSTEKQKKRGAARGAAYVVGEVQTIS